MYAVEDTIVAVASGNQKAPIGIIRISGDKTLSILKTIFHSKTDQIIPERQMKEGWVVEPVSKRNLDEALIVFYKGPRSYTREDMAELFTHGNPFIMNEIVAVCLQQGARLAEAGEFTYRAFVKGRIDLVQAEAIHELIEAESLYGAREALKKMEGRFSRWLSEIKHELLQVIADIEADINFADTDQMEQPADYQNQLKNVSAQLRNVVQNYRQRRHISEGIKVAILGKPNVGKSSLFNALLEKERSIITRIAGTTRDYISERIYIEGLPVTLYDTAGIREGKSAIEKAGIQKTENIIDTADTLIMVGDFSRKWDSRDELIIRRWKKKIFLIVINKKDLPRRIGKEVLLQLSHERKIALCTTSLIKGNGAVEVRQKLHEMVNGLIEQYHEEDFQVNMRQYDIVKRAYHEIQKSRRVLQQGISLEYAVVHLEDARKLLDRLTGESTTEDILDIIFSKFCIGK